MTCWLCGFETTELITNAKAPTCKNSPCQPCIAVTKVDEEIDQAVATLRRLLVKRSDLRLEQNRTHDLVRRLPLELKNYIFELLLPSRTEWGELLRRIKRPNIVMPSYLTSICRSWRDIGRSNPLLWSTIHVAVGRKTDPYSRIKLVQDWILRSRTMPLTLHLAVYDKNRNGLKTELKAIADAISQCSNRLHSLSIDTNNPLEVLRAFHLSSIQCHLLKRIRISTEYGCNDNIKRVPLPTMSPEKIELYGVPFRALRISWNHLSSAKIQSVHLEQIVELFQNASQMTDCHILRPFGKGFIMPPIIHQNLKSLRLGHWHRYEVPPILLCSLTLPSLQEFHTNKLDLLNHLPALVRRSSCPLTKITLSDSIGYESDFLEYESGIPDDLQPLPGVTDFVLETIRGGDATVVVRKLLLEDYLPDLRHLTLRLRPFLFLWDHGIIHLLLDQKCPPPDAPNEGRLLKFLVVDQDRAQIDRMWNSVVGKELEALNVSRREDGFEFL